MMINAGDVYSINGEKYLALSINPQKDIHTKVKVLQDTKNLQYISIQLQNTIIKVSPQLIEVGKNEELEFAIKLDSIEENVLQEILEDVQKQLK
jgi:uncharacterized protein YlaN (UPF0358 family)